MRIFRYNHATVNLLATAWLSFMPATGRAAFTTGNLAVFSADSASANNTTFTILELSPSTANQSSPVNSIAINGTSGGSALRTSGSASTTGYLADSDDGKLVVFAGHNTTSSSGNINNVLPRGVGTLDHSGAFTLQTTYTGGSGNQTRGACSVDDSLWWVGDQGGIYTNGTASTLRSGNFRSVKSFGGNLYVFVASASYPPVMSLATSPVATNALPGLPNGDGNGQDYYLISSGNNGSTFDVLYVLSASSGSAGTIYKYSLVSGSWTANGTYSTSFGGFGLCAARSGSGAVLYVTTGTGATAANKVMLLTDAAGYNTTISITTGNNVTLYTAAAGTTMKGIAFAPGCTAPTATVRSADSESICSGGSATIHADLTGTGPWNVTWSDGVTQTNVAASPATRTISPAITAAYTVTAVSDSSGCSPGTSSGSATVTVVPIPGSTIAAANSVCPDSTNNTASVPDAGVGASYGWTIGGGTITAGAGTAEITYTANPSGTVELSCTVTNSSGCYSNASSATATISEAVGTTAGNGGPYCAGATISLTASGSAGDTYSWTGPNGFTSSLQNPTIANATMAAAGDYAVTRTTACGMSAPSMTTVLVNAIPNSTIAASASVCGGSTGNSASVPDSGPGASYGWTITGGGITAGAGTASITYTAGASGAVILGCAVTNGSGCYSVTSGTTVTINPTPSSTITAAGSTYAGSSGNSASVPDAGAGATYAWTISGGNLTAGNGTSTVTFTAGGGGTLTLGCTVTANTGCSSVSSANVTVHPAFTTRDLAVVRIGDGSGTLSSAGTAVFVDEFSPSGGLVQSIALPTNGSSAFVTSGSASSEGALMRSPDASVLCLAGYSTNAGTASIAGTASASVPRAAATLNAGGIFSIAAITTTQFSGNNLRSAATDGANDFWAGGAVSGVCYLGTTAAAATIQSTLANTRVVNIFNGNLYFTSAAGGGLGLYSLDGLPVAPSAVSTNILTGTGSSPYGFALNPAGTVAYIADDRAIASGGGIQKWTNSGGAWSLAYTLGTGAGSTNGARGLTADFSGANAVIYATTTESSTNRLIAVADTGSTAVATTLATAAANTVFRGVAFTPESAPVITTQPLAQSACDGSTATFTSAADGAASLTAQWQASTDNGSTFADVPSAISANYSFTAGDSDLGKQFRVIYRNNYGAVTSSIAALNVYSATASNFTWDAYWGAPFKMAETNLLAHASGSGGVTLSGIDPVSANGVSLERHNGLVYYNGSLSSADSFHYTATSEFGGCPATALVTIAAITNVSPVSINLPGGIPLLNFSAIPGYSYTVQRSTNLIMWDDLLTTNAPDAGLFDYQDSAPPQPAGYYRLRYNP
ncbi:MAG TPA: hypothetical protein VMU04_08170 [Candidatus Acidoferrum sp.]|nr:hypothetical protein [Candidatus Acidoferrum sp.]